MILSGKAISEHIGKDIIIDPYDPKNLGPNSYDLHLHNELLGYDELVLDSKKENKREPYIISDKGFVLAPNKLYLGRTVEWTETYNLVPMIEGVSSIGRLGISIHITAGFGDVGFCGYWTLEITCVQPVIIYPGMRICQIYYHHIAGDCSRGYNGKYQNSKDIIGSKSFEDFK